MTADNPFATLIDTEALDWIETPGGNALKPLWVSEETGSWSALIKAKAGTVNPPHTHLGPADFYVITGSMEYRGGFAEPVRGCTSPPAPCTKPPRTPRTRSISPMCADRSRITAPTAK